MNISSEHRFLLESVKEWFSRSDQISYYSSEAVEGLTEAEQYFLDALPERLSN